ncbi:NADH-quinone oxidoreductase subunit C [Candidatus Methylopumilus universalis]|uniref:NADH-quinone oxidoreductase subunit C n=1 Tax=Candidatus Methylopumilus universalis TaxID=2588536 RepID=UPI00111E6962|nr:NADH-quinone oxidoreductase subunit C [Candidatus Methylopumilus universalis]QDC80028.1 NADH-quinone oxidoreductase subunit C [Candidatus Methylopumilus universalis]QDC81329.1 NADH-quinone oxidoreductase subunit C [Candidatus Methylopumilus universalis]QDC87767.1 NADH-quinone oxidoreductase subunit C [Candidatus Methylopumilus universalis]
MSSVETLLKEIKSIFGKEIIQASIEHNELTIEVKIDDLLPTLKTLKQHKAFQFAQLIDLCGVDFKDYGEGTWTKSRFAVVYHFLSIEHNHRIRVRTFSQEEDFPLFPSIIDLWPAANWYEREVFDLFGFMFADHPDLRRILTDYGFVGYPFRKDFPMIGKVEVRYDDVQKRVIYQPVSIEERNNVPRIIREEGFHNG